MTLAVTKPSLKDPLGAASIALAAAGALILLGVELNHLAHVWTDPMFRVLFCALAVICLAGLIISKARLAETLTRPGGWIRASGPLITVLVCWAVSLWNVSGALAGRDLETAASANRASPAYVDAQRIARTASERLATLDAAEAAIDPAVALAHAEAALAADLARADTERQTLRTEARSLRAQIAAFEDGTAPTALIGSLRRVEAQLTGARETLAEPGQIAAAAIGVQRAEIAAQRTELTARRAAVAATLAAGEPPLQVAFSDRQPQHWALAFLMLLLVKLFAVANKRPAETKREAELRRAEEVHQAAIEARRVRAENGRKGGLAAAEKRRLEASGFTVVTR